MKSHRLNWLLISVVLVKLFCGCQDGSNVSSGQSAIESVSANRQGEAFMVTQNDEVLYMADMQISFFKSRFKKDFESWISDWDKTNDYLIANFKITDPETSRKIEKLNEAIASLNDQNADAVAKFQAEKDLLTSQAFEDFAHDARFEFRKKFYEIVEKSDYSIQTGSKGDFSFPADMEFAFAKKGPKNGVTLIWFIRLDPKKPAQLSNSNVLQIGNDVDSFYWMLTRTPELTP
jgi:hypothetical protein